MAFLGCSEAAWTWLVCHGYVHLPGDGYGFDADEILAAQYRLKHFVSLEDLDGRFGVTNLTRCLIDWHVLPAATGKRDLWDAVDLTVVGRILDSLRLLSIAHSSIDAECWIRVCETPIAEGDLAEAYATVIARALRADIAALRWLAPYSLSDLWVTTADAERLPLLSSN